MKVEQSTVQSVDEYIAKFPANIQSMLEEVRKTIQQAAPQAEEAIRYQIPTLIYLGNLVHFAAFKRHIGFYPAPSGIEKFKNELLAYKSAKGSVQFPFDQPLPLELIRKIVVFRVSENQSKAALKNTKKEHKLTPRNFHASVSLME